ncbi:hypothetical protein NQ317_010615 [Molorchus minor]|uniref:EF-hand domain-containing protein n=1 Tax=Molorchus minor TaxID=1323400 RepID=A0ABQ9JD72_9CUCU|nr:hypothetical protein NQ317_010615 [Molorchus minor]
MPNNFICSYQPASPDLLLEAFRVLDAEGRGYLTKEEVSTLITQDGNRSLRTNWTKCLKLQLTHTQIRFPYEYYINQLMFEPVGEENNVYELADRIESEKPPPPPPPKRMSEFLKEMEERAPV